ncbi:hypothetical protein AQUCO_00201399v1 [Aquilegia coerulea]|uniref:Oxidative stress 3 n=1 Tax=Aquilegia coerulea TaxID=218851 RepID=A0A2G5F7W6_AQUCA|nr:hypothetical protein AQUCO_00201399v1 [Aquilegia coerulea]
MIEMSMSTSFNQQNNLGIMDNNNDQYQDDLDSISSSSSSNVSNASSNSSDFMEDATSSPSLSSSSSSDHTNGTTCDGPLYEMASLMQQLPLKRGLSKHFQGKSQSFTSLSNVRCLEDLAKPDHNPSYKKKLKSCKSYAGGLSETNKVSHPKTCSKTISKKASRGSWSSLSIAKRNNSFSGNKPPVPPQRSSSTLFNQTPLFA